MGVFEDAFYTYLHDDNGIANLVAERIYPHRGPEGVLLPYITWNRIGAQREYTYDAFEDEVGFVRARIQVNCWGHTPDEAVAVGEVVLAALSGYDGDMGGQLLASSFNVLEFDMYEVPTKLYRRTLDFIILYEDDLTTAS